MVGEVLGKVPALVVAAEQQDLLWVADLKRPEVQHTLDREVAPVDVVAEKQVAGLARMPPDLRTGACAER